MKQFCACQPRAAKSASASLIPAWIFSAVMPGGNAGSEKSTVAGSKPTKRTLFIVPPKPQPYSPEPDRITSLKSQASTGRERPANRVLEQEWIRRNWNDQRRGRRSSPPASFDSVLYSSMDLLGASREDICAFTHALMYVRDFKNRPLRLPRAKRLILADAEAALAWCLGEQAYDLAGEVLLAWPLTRTDWNAVCRLWFSGVSYGRR